MTRSSRVSTVQATHPRPTLWRFRDRLPRTVVVLALVAWPLTLDFGCAPKAGEEGGKCQDNGCNTYCNHDLVCTGGTCAPRPAAGNDAPSSCAMTSSEADAQRCAGDVAWSCRGGASPTGTCKALAPDDAGVALYCCAPACTPTPLPPAFSPCGPPSSVYSCDDPLSPEGLDSGLACVRFPPSFRAHTYCCAQEESCFQVPGTSLLPCASPSEQYFCRGAAPPTSVLDRDCVPVPYDGGSSLQGYCCAARDAGADGGP